MIKLLIKKFIIDYENVNDCKVRARYSILGGVVGIICNIFLFSVKLSSGLIMNSIGIISDAFNNLSDTGSSVISMLAVKLSNRRPDREHPFGHGRMEYIASLIVSFIIMIVGFQLLNTSYRKIVNPQPVEFNFVLIFLLSLSVLIKVWMYFYNRYIGRVISSSVNFATAMDSLNDVIATSAVILSTVAGHFLSVNIDGYIGCAVSLMVMYSGFGIARDTIGLLLGTQPGKEVVDKLESIILSGEGVVGVHDLIVHDYGPGRIFASAHAEVPDDIDIIKTHEVIDGIEQSVYEEMGITLVIHMDPISINCEKTISIKQIVIDTINSIDEKLMIHDFRMTDGENRINLIFDLVVPVTLNKEQTDEIISEISDKLVSINPHFFTVIKIDTSFN